MTHSIRSALVVVLSLATGCYTTGGKVFGTTGVASGVASVYLLASAGATIENHQLVTHDDHQAAGVALMFAAVIAAGGWAVSEIMFGPHSMGGGGGLPPDIAPAAEPAPPPAAEPAPPPAVEVAPAPAAEAHPGPPPVVIVRDRDHDDHDRPRSGWRLDPQDHLDRLHGGDEQILGWINPAGYVWYRTGGAAIGRVDIAPSCGPTCRHAQARQMLDRLR